MHGWRWEVCNGKVDGGVGCCLGVVKGRKGRVGIDLDLFRTRLILRRLSFDGLA